MNKKIALSTIGALTALSLVSTNSFASSKEKSHLSNSELKILNSSVFLQPPYVQDTFNSQSQITFTFKRHLTTKQIEYVSLVSSAIMLEISKNTETQYTEGKYNYHSNSLEFNRTFKSLMSIDKPEQTVLISNTLNGKKYGEAFFANNTDYESASPGKWVNKGYYSAFKSGIYPFFDFADMLRLQHSRQYTFFNTEKSFGTNLIYIGSLPVNIALNEISNITSLEPASVKPNVYALYSSTGLVIKHQKDLYWPLSETMKVHWNMRNNSFGTNLVAKQYTELLENIVVNFSFTDKYTYKVHKVTPPSGLEQNVTGTVYGN